MSAQLLCPHCQMPYRPKPERPGKTYRCLKCKSPLIPFPEPTAEPPSAPETSAVPRAPGLRLFWASVGWAVVGWYLALLAPWSAFILPLRWLGLLGLLVTAGLIAANLRAGFLLLVRTGRPLRSLPNTAAQVLLFTLLFFQIAAHLGSEYFALSGPTRWWDWIEFSAVHALRAADLLDAIEAYGLQLQTIRHNGFLMSAALVAFHLVINLFVLGLLFAWFGSLRRRAGSVAGRPGWGATLMARVPLFAAVVVAAWLVSALWVRPWHRADLLLWPPDNLLRLLDFADVMEVCDVRLHTVPREIWEGSLTFAFRLVLALLIGAALARAGRAVRVRYLGGAGLTREELDRFRAETPDEALRRKADTQLARLDREAARAALPVRWGLCGLVLLAVAVPAVAGAFVLPKWEEAVPRLVEAAAGEDEASARRALAALGRMGTEAGEALPALMAFLPQAGPARQLQIVEALGSFGPDAADTLADVAMNGDEATALAAVRSLRRIGPAAAPQLVLAQRSPFAPVREQADETLNRFGTDAVQPLLEALMSGNIPEHIEWVQRLDRNWQLRSTRNPLAREVLDQFPKVTRWRKELENVRLDKWSRVLAKADGFGPAAALATPEIVALLKKGYDPNLCRAVPETLGRIGPGARQAVPDLILKLADGDNSVRRATAQALGRIDPHWAESAAAKQAVSALAKQLADEYSDVRQAAAEALEAIGPGAREAAPYLRKLAENDPAAEVRSAARAALENIQFD